jgi:phospho-N-acetylmuramoyl-pentapeptide-transferase
MGDVGSYGLGGALIMLGMILNQEVIFILLYAVYLIEVICVIIQQVAVRVFKRRVFSYTPIHYAFVLKGMKDVNVVLMFYVFGALSLGVGLLTYFIGGF